MFRVLVVIWIVGYFLLDNMAKYSTYDVADIINWIQIAWFFVPIILGYFILDYFEKKRKRKKI